MTQYDFGTLSPADSGSTLAAKLSGVIPALLTQHKGPARPSYVQPGMMWIDDSGSIWGLNLYDGTADALVATIDPVTHSVQPAGRPSEAMTPLVFAAAAGQSAFALGTTVSPGACLVFQNGAKLAGTDYALTTSTLTLAAAATAGDIVTVIAFGAFDVADALKPAANLADLGNAAAARGNLGLGSAAVLDEGVAAGQLVKLLAGGRLPRSVFPSGCVIGRAYAAYSAYAALTAVIPVDDTIPQITEGTEILSLSYTPKSATSSLRITFVGQGAPSADQTIVAALFAVGSANALKSQFLYIRQNGMGTFHIVADIPSVGTSSRTFSVRVGISAGTLAINGSLSGGIGRLGGGSQSCTLTIEEIAP